MTPWQAWLHPHKAARHIAELENELLRLRDEHKQVQRNSELQIYEMREKIAVVNGQASRTLEQLNELKKKYNRLKQQSESEQQRKSTLFADYQEDIDKLKAGYERRLEHLRHALDDANAMLANRRDYDALQQMTLIDMTPEAPPAGKQQSAPKSQPKQPPTPAKTPDWLEPLPD